MSLIVRFLLAMLYLGALTLPAAHAQAPQPFWVYTPLILRNANAITPPNYRIAFVGLYGRLSTIRADRTEATVLTHLNDVGQPSWSPDGTTLAFKGSARVAASDAWASGVYTMPADGHTAPRLIARIFKTWNDEAVQWSADGRYLAYTELLTDTGPVVATVVRTDGSQRHHVSGNVVMMQNTLTWSPDGKQLAFLVPREFEYDLYLVNREGTHLQRVPTPGVVRWYHWSPKSTQLIITVTVSTGATDLYLVPRDGTSAQPLTTSGTALYAAWAPNGTEFAYTEDNHTATGTPPHLMLFDLASRHATVLTTGTVSSWSPDGTQLLYADTSSTAVIQRDGTQRRNVFIPPDTFDIHWSPDSTRLLATNQTERTSDRALFVLGTAGETTPLMTIGGISYRGVWEPHP